MTCASCGIDEDTRSCELVNGSTMDLCFQCRGRFDRIIAAVPIYGDGDFDREEANALAADVYWPAHKRHVRAEEAGAL